MCQKTLQRWVRKKDANVENRIREVSQRLNYLQMQEDGDQKEEENTLQDEMYFMLEQEDLKWSQRAKEDWLKYRDRNTKFFHACATQRNRRKQISKIVDKEKYVALKLTLRQLL
jgi:hypothetical protein